MVCCMCIHIRNQVGDTFYYLKYNNIQCPDTVIRLATIMEVLKEVFYPLVYQITFIVVVSFFASLQDNRR